MQKRRKYSREYKIEAVQLAEQAEIPLTQVARNLGINPNMLGRWRKQLSEPDKTAFPGNGTARDQELANLRRELKQIKKERDFLREAAAYFAREPK